MTIEHLAACDGCGSSARAVECHEADGVFHAPDPWVELAHEGNVVQFCSWICVATFVSQKIREEEVATPAIQES